MTKEFFDRLHRGKCMDACDMAAHLVLAAPHRLPEWRERIAAHEKQQLRETVARSKLEYFDWEHPGRFAPASSPVDPPKRPRVDNMSDLIVLLSGYQALFPGEEPTLEPGAMEIAQQDLDKGIIESQLKPRAILHLKRLSPDVELPRLDAGQFELIVRSDLPSELMYLSVLYPALRNLSEFQEEIDGLGDLLKNARSGKQNPTNLLHRETQLMLGSGQVRLAESGEIVTETTARLGSAQPLPDRSAL